MPSSLVPADVPKIVASVALNVPGLPAGSIGYVNLLGFLALVPASVMMAPFGARLAHGISRRTLEIIMGLFIATVSMRFLVAIVAGY